MIPTVGPLDRLRAANPVPVASVNDARPDLTLFRAIVADELDRRPQPRARRHRLRMLVPALAVTGLLGGTVASALLRDTVPEPPTVGCYERADLEARTEVVGVGPEGPLAGCAELWRQGVLGRGGEVPPLTECVLGPGVVGVFPARTGPDVCTGLGAIPSPATTATAPRRVEDASARVRAFREAVLPQFLDAPCVDRRVATDTVRRELDRAGLGDWRVTGAGQFTVERPCATLEVRPEYGEVVLVPSPPRR